MADPSPRHDNQLRPRRTHRSNQVFRLPGGTEDSDLWVEVARDGEQTVIVSTWEPSAKQRQRIADGENVELVIWGGQQPPVAVSVSDVPLGKAPSS
jgi:hypothetical protein